MSSSPTSANIKRQSTNASGTSGLRFIISGQAGGAGTENNNAPSQSPALSKNAKKKKQQKKPEEQMLDDNSFVMVKQSSGGPAVASPTVAKSTKKPKQQVKEGGAGAGGMVLKKTFAGMSPPRAVLIMTGNMNLSSVLESIPTFKDVKGTDRPGPVTFKSANYTQVGNILKGGHILFVIGGPATSLPYSFQVFPVLIYTEAQPPMSLAWACRSALQVGEGDRESLVAALGLIYAEASAAMKPPKQAASAPAKSKAEE